MSKKAPERIVVTGATGLIGARIVARLAGQGHHVIALVRDPTRDRNRAPGAAEYVEWSASAEDGAWVGKLDGADGVIHLAGSPIGVRWNTEVKRAARESRVVGTRNLVRAIARAERRPRALVSASVVGYYGSSPEGTVTEDSPHGNDFLATLCADWEAEAFRASDYGVRTTTIRTGIALDPRGGALARLLLPFKLFVGGPIGSGNQPFPWIHIEDEEGIFLWALDSEHVAGPLNATAPNVVTNKEFSRALGAVLHRPSLLPVPSFVLRLILGEGAPLVTEGQHATPERTLKLGYEFRHTDVREALIDLLK
jgi:uncharacterized protein (TIGR01777 family)